MNNCMDVMTKSPSEGHDRVPQKGPNECNGKMNLGKSLSNLITSTMICLGRRLDKATVYLCKCVK